MPKANGETIEEAARRLRYRWFRQLMASGEVEAVATAHTRDDQAETVLAKFLRGAWTEGLSGIHPVVEFPEGRILRPLLSTTRAEVEAYLGAQGQGWREDSSNRHLTYTRNRIRHELLPLLEGWNPRLREHLAQMAQLARDEEAWWTSEVAGWLRSCCCMAARYEAEAAQPAMAWRSMSPVWPRSVRHSSGGFCDSLRKSWARPRFSLNRGAARAGALRKSWTEIGAGAGVARRADAERVAAGDSAGCAGAVRKLAAEYSVAIPGEVTLRPSGCGCGLKSPSQPAHRRTGSPRCATGGPATAFSCATPPARAR